MLFIKIEILIGFAGPTKPVQNIIIISTTVKSVSHIAHDDLPPHLQQKQRLPTKTTTRVLRLAL